MSTFSPFSLVGRFLFDKRIFIPPRAPTADCCDGIIRKWIRQKGGTDGERDARVEKWRWGVERELASELLFLTSGAWDDSRSPHLAPSPPPPPHLSVETIDFRLTTSQSNLCVCVCVRALFYFFANENPMALLSQVGRAESPFFAAHSSQICAKKNWPLSRSCATGALTLVSFILLFISHHHHLLLIIEYFPWNIN